MKYHQPYGISDPGAPYINGDPSIGRQGSIIPAAAVEYPQRELANFITVSNLEPTDDDLYQLAKSAQAQTVNYAVDIGNQNAMHVAVMPPLSSYPPGLVLRVQLLHSVINDATHTTFTLDAGAGAAPVVKTDGSMPATNDLKAGGIYTFVSDGTRFQLSNFGGAGGGGSSTTVNVKIPYVRDTGTVANQLRAIYSPAITTVTEGDFIAVKLAISLVSAAATIAINALPTYSIKHPDGTNPTQGDAVGGQTLLLCYDGAAFQIIGVIGTPSVIRPRLLVSVPYPGGQSVAVRTMTQVTSMSNIIESTLQTSTWTGNAALTIGAGEDGLWNFGISFNYGNLTTSQAVYVWGVRQRAGVNSKTFSNGYAPYGGLGAPAEDTGAMGDGMIECAVGDQLTFWTAIWASGGPYQLLQSNQSGYDVTPQVTAHLVSRHLI
jgi:hypothetical protein